MFDGMWLLFLIIHIVNGYGSFRDEIPNGHHVPHPCKANYLWKGVGHQLVDGGKTRNSFGLDFKAAGAKWTQELCQKDSDGDGTTNGEELGDPDCTWQRDSVPSSTTGLTHPGVCEPLDDAKCQPQAEWVTAACKYEKFNCSGINNADVEKQVIKFPDTPVPAEETTYMCMEFNLDNSSDFHLIATEPIVENTNVMHHAVIFGCDPRSNHELRDKPEQCGMIASRECSKIISIWTLGSPGECFNDKIGFRIGTQGYKRVALQFHWNNPQKRTDYIDSSGMILYYTKNKREFDAGIFTIGADYLEIPPLTPRYESTSVCPGSCSIVTGKVYAVTAFNHMHYLGRSQKVEVIRNGQKVTDLTNDDVYNYDSPVVHHHTQPVEILPGDTISTTCVYNSENRQSTTYFGDATSSEMCYAFITYFPVENIKNEYCTAWKSLPNCQLYVGLYNGCNVGDFAGLKSDDRFNFTTLNGCNTKCSPECNGYYDELFKHPCMADVELREYIVNAWSYRDEGKLLTEQIKNCSPGGLNPEQTEVKNEVTTPQNKSPGPNEVKNEVTTPQSNSPGPNEVKNEVTTPQSKSPGPNEVKNEVTTPQTKSPGPNEVQNEATTPQNKSHGPNIEKGVYFITIILIFLMAYNV